MTDYTYYEFKMHDGLPPEPGYAYGFDEFGFPYVLNWHEEQQCWYAIGFENNGDLPFVVRCVDESAGFIVKWSWAPFPWALLEQAANG